LITERPIRFVFRGTVVEHKPRPHWATVHAVVAVFSDYTPCLKKTVPVLFFE